MKFGRAWMDEDGERIWFEHDCFSERRLMTILPPGWRIVDGKVEPSIECTVCGYHEFVPIGERP